MDSWWLGSPNLMRANCAVDRNAKLQSWTEQTGTGNPIPPKLNIQPRERQNAPFSPVWFWGKGEINFPCILSKIVDTILREKKITKRPTYSYMSLNWLLNLPKAERRVILFHCFLYRVTWAERYGLNDLKSKIKPCLKTSTWIATPQSLNLIQGIRSKLRTTWNL